MTEPQPGVAAAVEGELRLLDPLVRCSADLLVQVLHPEFREIDTASTAAGTATRPSPR